MDDAIIIHFKNNTRFPATVHPHGVFYDKDSEGAPYADGTSGVPNCGLPHEEFEESNLMHGINGRAYGNNTGYSMREGEKIRWYLLGMGTEVDLHTPHWHGNTGIHDERRMDVMEVLPSASKVFDMLPDNAGTWLYHCHVNDHIKAGMVTTYTVFDD